MINFSKEDLEEALRATASMISRTETAKERFAPGTSQHTLQKNRLMALKIASALISKELAGGVVRNMPGKIWRKRWRHWLL
jgi:hypothetical protein